MNITTSEVCRFCGPVHGNQNRFTDCCLDRMSFRFIPRLSGSGTAKSSAGVALGFGATDTSCSLVLAAHARVTEFFELLCAPVVLVVMFLTSGRHSAVPAIAYSSEGGSNMLARTSTQR